MAEVDCEGISVTAIEAFPPMAALAKTIVEANGMADAIKVINKHSSDVSVTDSSDPGDPSALTAPMQSFQQKETSLICCFL